MVSMVAGLVLALGTQLFVTKVDPSYIEWLKESAVERLAETPELSEEDRASHREQIEQLTPLNYAVQTMTSTLMSGFFLSITLAALFRMRTIRVAKA